MMLRKRWFLLTMVGKLIRNFGEILQFASICRVRVNAPFFVQHFIFVILIEKITACCFLRATMSKIKKEKIEAKGFSIEVYTEDFKNDYISLTDIARYKNKIEPNVVVANWMRNHNTIEYLGIWEQLNNPEFNPIEFEGFLKEAGSNAFTLSPQRWSNNTNAKGIFVKLGRGGGTFAHKDIAFKFASWISAEFELYIIKDYQRLKEAETSKLSLTLNDLTESQLGFKYASEADMLNVALFNKTAKEWRDENKNVKGNMRDYASLNELLVLANMESYNAILIEKGLEQKERMIELRKLARNQMLSLEKLGQKNITLLEDKK